MNSQAQHHTSAVNWVASFKQTRDASGTTWSRSIIRQMCKAGRSRKIRWRLGLLVVAVVVLSQYVRLSPPLLLTTTTTTSSRRLSGYDYVLNAANESFMHEWRQNTASFCQGRLLKVSNEFVVMQDATVDRRLMVARGNRGGGETIEETLHQHETIEYFDTRHGAFTVECGGGDGAPSWNLRNPPNWLNRVAPTIAYCTATNSTGGRVCDRGPEVVDRTNRTLLVVERYDYANLWHSMCDFHDAFLTLVYAATDPASTDVLLFDAHPRSAMDAVWRGLFSRQLYVRDLPDRTRYGRVILSMYNHNAFLSSYFAGWETQRIPLTEHFRSFVLRQFDVDEQQQQQQKTGLECQKLRVTFLFRRDYLSHPRNVKAAVGRKIGNPDELIAALNAYLTNSAAAAVAVAVDGAGHSPAVNTSTSSPSQVARVNPDPQADPIKLNKPQGVVHGEAVGVYFENVTMAEQLRVISTSDVLIGYHGAGLAHSMFLPKHGGLIELSQTHSKGRMFESIAQCRNISYVKKLVDPILNDSREHMSRVDPNVVIELLQTILGNMGC